MKRLFSPFVFTSLLFFAFTSEKNVSDSQLDYVCLPCGSGCDTIFHKGPGTCSHCNMTLVKHSTIKHKNVEPQDLCAFMAKQEGNNVLLLDVRTTAEFEGRAAEKYGRLNNAVNIPIQELEARMKELKTGRINRL